MSHKSKVVSRWSADEHILVEHGISESHDGFILFVKKGGRHVHLTVYQKGDRYNAHITDTSKNPSKVWEVDITKGVMEEKARSSLIKCLQKYNWNEKYFTFNKKFLEMLPMMGIPLNFIEEWPVNHNVNDLIKMAHLWDPKDTFYEFIPIREGLKECKIGYQKKGPHYYLVVPIDKNTLLRMNMNWKFNYQRYVPEMAGIHKFHDYIEKERIIDWMELMSRPEVLKNLRENADRLSSEHNLLQRMQLVRKDIAQIDSISEKLDRCTI